MKKTLAIPAILAFVITLTIQCATLAVTLGFSTLQQGQTQTIQSVVVNCDSRKMKLGLTVSVTDSLGNFTLLRNTIQNYNGGQSVTFNDSYQIPADAPIGTYRIVALVHDNSPQGGGAEIARATQEFQVTAAE